MAKIILTGFKPFMGDLTNPSEIICSSVSSPHLIAQVLPVDFNQAFLDLKKTIELEKPDHVIMLGLASGRDRISLEKVALNWNESKYPDEAGNCVNRSKINPANEPLALMTSFPINELQDFLDKKKYPVQMSFSAGTYVCNNLYYKVLTEFPELKSIFIHVPYFTEVNQEMQINLIKDVLVFCSLR
ncbi:MAG: pyroglutamyl-peptidase I [Bdellovibrionaceae bacterium]|nr:pyroglutamyl-peptidase I [Pseudobdellovibrionaceae bacterium]